MIIISDSQLWKLDGNTLLNKEGLWMSDEKWNFKTVKFLKGRGHSGAGLAGPEPFFRHKYTELICIENINKTKVCGTNNDWKVILEKFEEDKYEQLWKKGKPNAEGYFTLESYKVSKVMTATSSISLELKGNIIKVDNRYRLVN